jgi:transcription initiation factor IIE alpha subunit
MTPNDAVGNVSQLSEAISKYGLLTVILAVFLLLFLLLVLFIINSNQKFINILIDQNNKFINELTESVPQKNYEEENIVEIFTKLNEVFKDECKKINEKTSSSRTAIYVFHNGSVASHGLPFFKMTCVSEWISRGSGFQEQMSKHTNLNLALFGSLIEELYNTGVFLIRKCSNEELEPFTYVFMSEKPLFYYCHHRHM